MIHKTNSKETQKVCNMQ